jgi:hypothetical protein
MDAKETTPFSRPPLLQLLLLQQTWRRAHWSPAMVIATARMMAEAPGTQSEDLVEL